MPHITVKMLHGRSDAQKQAAAEKLTAALAEALGCGAAHITLAVEEYTPQEWQDVFRTEIAGNPALLVQPQYDPKDLL